MGSRLTSSSPAFVIRPGPRSLLAIDEHEADIFSANYDRAAFAFHHNLHRRFREFFSLQRLREAATRICNKNGHGYVESGTSWPAAKWGSAPNAVKPASLSDAIDRIADNSFWVVLTRLHLDPAYQPLLYEILDELSLLVGYPILSRYYDPILTVLITSPQRITPSHADHDTNLLFQIQGPKKMFVFDGNDPEIFPEEARERFWNGDTQAFAWRPELQSRALSVQMVPGVAVHVPTASPHWLQNGQEISISVSINVKRRVDIIADTYKLNARLRRAGFSPSAPGRSQVHDRAMSLAWRSASGIAHLLHHRRPAA